MSTFATVADLSRYLQRDISTAELPNAEMSLEVATAAIQGVTGQSLFQVAETGLVLDGSPVLSSVVILPSAPVVSVQSVEILSTADYATWTTLTFGVDYIWSTDGILTRITNAANIDNPPIAPSWPQFARTLRVAYTHGYYPIPEVIRDVCVAAAARLYSNPEGIVTEKIGEYSVRYATNAHGVTFTDAEDNILGRYREVAVA